ncbi:SDR family oxidoreductase [Pectobacterium versatile]|uniref:SDR family oxidoreductase n=1 Tax=Pectobacterium versatile TaxID=2488639 RepID=UPI000F8E2C74|nr:MULTISPECIES: NAD(P)H-binding protein [Pectobacterium]GKV80866.1 hydroxylase [Pectobacterium carotovorum subsp. carotovorum]MBQ4774703.1 NAD(P)H-binding protein [Pectobacterium versatile]MCA5930958.1 NAD(P)H-binding protein [Pectobacterium versatile]MCA5948154.1 NAD(P)H-binding protein [Pectobacterium versatile]MCA5952253.1 NAD(P)H-binding protein [Pectobacterium versatile]
MKFIIHGATGAQGAPLYKKLITEGKNAVAAVRNPADIAGGQTVAVDMSSVDSLVKAYTDADGVFIHLPLGSEDQRLHYAYTVAEAVDKARPKRVVISTSGWKLEASSDNRAVPALIREIENTGVSVATVAPVQYLENLLLPIVIEAIKQEHKLPYPLRDDFPVSWCSHLDVADVAAVLLTHSSLTGAVSVGMLPALTGTELALAFSSHYGYDIKYESQTPEAFGKKLSVLFGEAAAAEVAAAYEAKAKTTGATIDPKISAQKQLGLSVRTVEQWLSNIGA